MVSREKHRYGFDNKPKSHNKSYHKFFSGYTEMTVISKNGKKHIVRTYTGEYYRQDLSQKQRSLVRLLYILLFLFAETLCIWNAAKPLLMNFAWYVVLPQALCIALGIWMIIILCSYFSAQRDMTIGNYRSSSKPLKYVSGGLAICFGVAALASLLFFVFNPEEQPFQVLVCMLKYILAGVSMAAMNRIECKIKYLKIPNPNKAPEGSVTIS